MSYKWEVINDFKGRSHEEGGIDISISDGKIELKRNNSLVKAANGLMIPSEGGPKNQQKKYSREPSEAHKQAFENVRQEYLTNINKPEYRERLRAGMWGETSPADDMEKEMREKVLDQQILQRVNTVNNVKFTVDGTIGARAKYDTKKGIILDPIDYSKYPKKYWEKEANLEQINPFIHTFKQISPEIATDVLRHELQHGLDQELSKDFKIESDINSRERLNNGKEYFNIEGVPLKMNDKLQDILSKKNYSTGLLKQEKKDLEYFKHYTEVSARINALRLDAQKRGYKYEDEFKIQDYFPESIETMKKDMDKYHHLYDLKKILKLSDDEINELAKLIANNQSNPNSFLENQA